MDTQRNIAPLVTIVGETGAGKSALAHGLAQRFHGEIICADSTTVRRRADIGTAKPTAAERTVIPHHLVDVAEPCEPFTAAQFKHLAQAAIEDISARERLPIMVGGTGLYIDGLLYDFTFLPKGSAVLRKELDLLSLEELESRVIAEGLNLEAVDVHNRRRLIRLIETGGRRGGRSELRPRTLLIGIQLPREELEDRIIARTDEMLKVGLEQEVMQLSRQCGWTCEALKGIGYREWREYFEGRESLSGTRDKIIRSTLALAKRQRTWFRRNKDVRWLDSQSKLDEVVELVTTELLT